MSVYIEFTNLYVILFAVIEKDDDKKNLREMKPGEMFGVNFALLVPQDRRSFTLCKQ